MAYVSDSATAGTAGLRGLVGTGFNRMNNIVVQQTTQGFCKYLQQQAGQKLASRGVVIGAQQPTSQSEHVVVMDHMLLAASAVPHQLRL